MSTYETIARTRRETKAESLRALTALLGGRLGTATILFHAAIGDRLGLGPTEAKCRMLLLESGSVTAGELAARTGLTTGAITGVIDRLEASGWARRVADPRDRRRVVVEPVRDAKREREVARLYRPLAESVLAATSKYDATQLALLRAFVTEACDILECETRRLRRT
jgi:DNA-binding MarR family transcriptional regulator